ncbi:unnamed protein product [Linum trigynum]|uniref:Uncharacterized protein n=1 Tax=Linum trigynum TaxID=586398 RepID=A0AAV2F8N4_9ROSI
MIQSVPCIEDHSDDLPHGTLVTKFIESVGIRLDDYVFLNSKSVPIIVSRVMKLSNTYDARRDRIHNVAEDAPDKRLRIGSGPYEHVFAAVFGSDDDSIWW